MQEGLIDKSVRSISRDEMNLAEFPLTVLSTRVDPKIKTLEFCDTIFSKDGKPVNRRWIITGADKFGLPTSSDDEILLGLLKLTVDSGFQDRKVFFTRYELLRALRWSTEGRSYQRLQNALDRLSGVRIKASNAFFDNETKAHSTRNFGIIDAYEINDGRDNPKPSFFIWSEVLFKSFQVGFIKKLDLDFFLDLRTAVSRRLYRYLDKHFWYKSKLVISLFTLAHEKIGISRNYRYPSSLRQQLDPAFEELIERGFLREVRYQGRGKETEVVIFAARGARKAERPSIEARKEARDTGEVEVPSAKPLAGLAGQVLELLLDRGLHERQAAKLLESKSDPELERIAQIVAYFDDLCAQGSHLVRKSPVGFLYRAVERSDRFVLPGEKPQMALTLEASAKPERRKRPTSNVDARLEDEKSRYLVYRKREIERLRGVVEPDTLSRIEGEVEKALAKIQDLIAPARFKEAVSHAVDEKLANLFAVPDFSEWRQLK